MTEASGTVGSMATTYRQKPICYVDIDGVINLLRPKPELEVIEVKLPPLRPGVRTKTVRFDPLVRDRIAALGSLFEMRWSSGWQKDCPTRYAPAFGFGEDWPWVDFDSAAPPPPEPWTIMVGGPPPATNMDWKMPGFIKDAGFRPFVLFDDTIQTRHRHMAVMGFAQQNLLIKPHQRVGLTDDHVLSAMDFAFAEI